MLAAQCAWTILQAEHSQLRQLLASIEEALHSPSWHKPGPALVQLRQRIEALQTFDHHSHRPKGVVLMQALRGRAADTDRFTEGLEHEREREDDLLAAAVDCLEALAAGDEDSADECAALLAEHRAQMLHHLEEEDTTLFVHSNRLLSEEEWSSVVSSISSVLYPGEDAAKH
jgi:hemerythrin-like domain-containing protein